MNSRLDVEQSLSPAQAIHNNRPSTSSRRVELCFVFFLACCAMVYLYRADVKVLWIDELLSYHTDHVATVRDVVKVQMNSPIALDPPLSHIVQHFSLSAGNGNLLVYRLPSILFSCGMLWCVYVYLRRLGGVYLGALTICILMLTPLIESHLIMARPYAMLMGASGATLLLWQNCIRGRARTGSLIGLFFASGVGVASHYYGFLLLIPFVIAETYRAFERRKLDIASLGALLGSSIFAFSWLPCMKAAKTYSAHYYDSPPFSLAEMYKGFFSPLHEMMTLQRGEHARSVFLSAEHYLFLLFLVALAFGIYAGYKRSFVVPSLRAEWLALGLLALVPACGVLLSHVAGATYEGRFALEYWIGIAAALSAGVLFLAKSHTLRNGVLVLLCFAIVGNISVALRSNLRRRDAVLAYIEQLNKSALARADQPVVFADYEMFFLLNARYQAVAPFAPRMIWLYDLDRAVDWQHTDVGDRTMMNLGKFTSFSILPYSTFSRTTPQFRLFTMKAMSLNNPESSWLPYDIRATGGTLRPVESIKDHSGLVGDHEIYEVHTRSETR